jgi:hypothetical protein
MAEGPVVSRASTTHKAPATPTFSLMAALLQATPVGDPAAIMRFGLAGLIVWCSLSAAAFGASERAGGRRSPAGAPSSNAAARSSSRITMTTGHLVGADGATTAPSVRFHDELLNVDCFPSVASDGVMRCLPYFRRPETIVFADATCTTPLAQMDASSCWNPPYTVAGRQFVTIAGEYSRSGPLFRRDSQKCVEAPRSLRRKYFTLGGELPPAKFAAFMKRRREVHVPPGGDGNASATGAPATSGSRITLVTEQFVGPDGVATTPTEHFRDEKLEVDCSPGLASDGVMRCLPGPDALPSGGHFAANSAFADPSCTIPLAHGPNPRKDPVPPYAVSYTEVVASLVNRSVPHFHRVLGEYSRTAPVFSDFTGRCIEAERSPLRGYFNIGPEIPPSELVEFTKRTISNKGASGTVGVAPMTGSRISVTSEQLVGADGTATTPTNTRYRDEKLGTDCSLRPAADGIWRCIPTDVASTASPLWFADAACTNPLATVWIRDRSGIPSYALQETRSVTGTCEINRLHVFFLGPEYGATQPVFYAGSGKCMASRNDSYRYFTFGAEVPPTDFVAFVESEGANRSLRDRRKAR